MVVTAVTLALSASSITAESNGTRSGEFLSIYNDARPAALGGAFTAVADNAAGLLYNPAGLVRPESKEITLSFVDWFENGSFQHASYTHPMGGGKDAFGLSFLYFNPGSFWRTNELGLETNYKLKAHDLAATVGYGREFGRFLRLGISGKYVRRKLDVYEASAWACDLGAQYQPLRSKLVVGLSLQNIGTSLQFINDREQLPLTVRLGVSHPFILDRLVLVGEMIKVADEKMKFAVGGEAEVVTGLKVRGGWNNEDSLARGFAVGLGYNLKSVGIDYAYVPYRILGGTHRFTGTFRFGEPKNPNVHQAPNTVFPSEAPAAPGRPETRPEVKVTGADTQPRR